jgi:hypothetical protein
MSKHIQIIVHAEVNSVWASPYRSSFMNNEYQIFNKYRHRGGSFGLAMIGATLIALLWDSYGGREAKNERKVGLLYHQFKK